MKNTTDFVALGVAAAELIHDMRGLLALVDARMALVLGEMRAGRLAPAELEVALVEHRDLSAMVADMVDAISHRPAPGDASIRLVEVVRAEIDRAVLGCPPVDVQLLTTVPENTTVAGRASFLRRAVGNLLRNACRHARSHVRVGVYVEARVGRAGIRIAVEDDGFGVVQALRANLFHPTVHGDHGGSGLGLASAAWVVAQLGGEIGYRDGEELGGGCFEIWLPASEPRWRQRRARVADKALAGHSLVLVDDDPSILRVFTQLLGQMGARVLPLIPAGAYDDIWLDAVARVRPDAILLDLDLGAQDGLQIWEWLHQEAPELAERVVFVSGAIGQSLDHVMDRTGRPVIGKPLDLAQVVRAVEKVTLEER